MKAFLFGLGLGIGLGVLFAPMSGQETRDNISERASDLANSAKETFEQGRDQQAAQQCLVDLERRDEYRF